MTDGRLNEGHQLCFVARKASPHEGGADFNADSHQINRHIGIDIAFFAHRLGVHSGRVLTFGQSVASIVLNDISHVEVTAHDVRKLTHADRCGIAVSRHADIYQVAIGEISAGCDRGHATMHAIKAVGTTQKISWRFGGAANAR